MSTPAVTPARWETTALLGIVAILFGLGVLIWPHLTLGVLIYLFAAYALVTGILAIFAAFDAARRHIEWWAPALEGIFGVGIALLAFFWPNAGNTILLYFIAFWAMLTGAPQIISGVKRQDWLLALGGAVLIAFGLVLVATSGTGAVGAATIIALFAIAYGGVTLARATKLQSAAPLAH